jgi:hypothetical protein
MRLLWYYIFRRRGRNAAKFESRIQKLPVTFPVLRESQVPRRVGEGGPGIAVWRVVQSAFAHAVHRRDGAQAARPDSVGNGRSTPALELHCRGSHCPPYGTERFENSLFGVKKLPVPETTGSFIQAPEFTL